jgi:hypothetical protein
MDGLFSRSLQRGRAFFLALTILPMALASTPTLALASSSSSAGEDEDHFVSYDSIIRSLQNQTDGYGSSSRAKARANVPYTDPFDTIMIHAGVGYSGLVETVALPDGDRLFLNQKGFQASLGIDLFSEHWMAEGTARSFGESEENASARAQLKEFELKVLYKKRFSGQMGLHAGGGLSGRYLTIYRADGALEYTTPSSLAVVGLDLFMNENLSLGLDLAGRQAMIGETVDRSSFDATVRLDTHF